MVSLADALSASLAAARERGGEARARGGGARAGRAKAPGARGGAHRAEAGEEEAGVTARRSGGAVEVEIDGRRLLLRNLDKVFYPDAGFTKRDVIDYYARVAPVLLPHLQDRPLTLKRYPDGVDGPFFYEKRCPRHRPEWFRTEAVWSEGNEELIRYCVVDDLASLVWLASIADLELHAALAYAPSVDSPTVLVFDLDPGPPADILACCDVALLLRRLMGAARPRVRGQDLRLEGHAGLRAAQRAGELRPDEALRARRRPAPRGAPPGARRRAHDEEPARREGARRLEPERPQQDHRLRVLPARPAASDGLDAAALARGGARRPHPSRRRRSSSRRARCSRASIGTATSSSRSSRCGSACPRPTASRGRPPTDVRSPPGGETRAASRKCARGAASAPCRTGARRRRRRPPSARGERAAMDEHGRLDRGRSAPAGPTAGGGPAQGRCTRRTSSPSSPARRARSRARRWSSRRRR